MFQDRTLLPCLHINMWTKFLKIFTLEGVFKNLSFQGPEMQFACGPKSQMHRKAKISSIPVYVWTRLGRTLIFYIFCSHLTHFIFDKQTFSQYFTKLYRVLSVPCLIPALPAGDLSVTQSRVACSCGHRSPSPPGKCSAGATGAETVPHLFVSVAQRMPGGCSQTAHWGLEVYHLHRSGSPVYFHLLI